MIMKLKTRLFIISILILLASAQVIISGAAHNVPKVGLAYDPMNNSLQIIHINPPPESTMDMGSGIGSDLSPIWPYHLALVSTGFLLVLSAALTARFMKRRKGWLSIHRSLGIFGVVLILTGLVVAAIMVSSPYQIDLMKEPHAYLGLTIALMAAYMPFLGYLQIKRRDNRLRTLHRWSGRVVLAFMVINVGLGLIMLTS
jgi:hypothetical protein